MASAKKYLTITKTKLHCLFFALALLADISPVAAQGARFFRISGPAATTIMAFNPDGTLVWSNAQPGTNYIVQTIASLPGGTNWMDYVRLPVASSVNTNLIFSFNPPAGMVLIPAGFFTMGNSIGDSDITDANPTNIYVSGFYMDVNLVTSNQWQTVYTYATNHGYGFYFPLLTLARAANYPVETVDWFNAVKWRDSMAESNCLHRRQLESGGLFCAEWLWTLRYGGECF